MKVPKVSVIMSVYNGGRYLHGAIESILQQTLTDFEFIIINDGSTDDSKAVIASFDDPRIRLLNQTNQGLIASLNRGLKEAKGEYIARQDADDESLPQRLELEAGYLDKYPAVVMLGSCYEVMNESGKAIGIIPVLTDDADIRQEFAVNNPFGHGSIMARRQAVLEAGGYNAEFSHVEDYDLWRRLKRHGKLANLPAVLYRWRDNPASVSEQNRVAQQTAAKRIQDEEWSNNPIAPLPARTIRERAKYYSRQSQGLGRLLAQHYLLTQLRLSKRQGRASALSVLLSGAVGARVVIKALTKRLKR